jgi:GGDEF domain-containing protein
MAALAHESARHIRYGRPATVLLIELDGGPSGAALDRVARKLAELIRAQARETDRAVRVGVASFRMLLPETSGRAARHVVARLDRAFYLWRAAQAEPTELRTEIVAPVRGGSLEEALAEAERRRVP